MPDFLLEIGCEEIPARMIGAAEEELGKRVHELCVRERLLAAGDDNHAKDASVRKGALSTPRRLAILLKGVSAKQPDIEEQLQGPATKIAFKDGKPTAAAEAFAKKAGVGIAHLERVSTAKGEYLSARVVRKGEAASKVLAALLPKEISSLYWPKNMYWRAGAPERFVRPIRWMVAMLDGEVIPLEFAGVKAGNVSRGHRLFSDGVKISKPSAYIKELEKVHVLADPREREQRIRKALDAETRKLSGVRWREDVSLLDTVVNLTEWPSVILGSFDKSYLALPEEVLVTVMRDHQKYFAVEDAQAKLLPYFLAVLNTDGDPDGLIRHGNERVLRARFNDAQFFWQTDQKTPLKQRIELLKAVTFQKDLGSYYEKTVRVEKLAGKLAEDLGDTGVSVNLEALENAAWLCKTDLTTELVKE
ncbi:MAG TPA: glycine--tRNA ligase subunit beta, partial [Terriglobales bacterium]|nr:glycine--tRNA ligase subunit beta [Terriglobales bacterium]